MGKRNGRKETSKNNVWDFPELMKDKNPEIQ